MNSTWIEKKAFLVHESLMIAHYAPVWNLLDPGTYEIITTGAIEANITSSAAFAEKLGQGLIPQKKPISIETLIRDGSYYKWVISNHKIRSVSDTDVSRKSHGKPAAFEPQLIGDKQIRFMYGLDMTDKWSLAPWNEMYDLFMCHGPSDLAAFHNKFGGKAVTMGFPRFDTTYADKSDLKITVNNLATPVNASEDFWLWIPTWEPHNPSACSIITHMEALRPFSKKIICRPHPIFARSFPEKIQLLLDMGFRLDLNATRSSLDIVRKSSAMLCDSGGSVFSGVLYKKPIVFLRKEKEPPPSEFIDHAVDSLAKHFPVLTPSQTWELNRIFSDFYNWQKVYESSSSTVACLLGSPPITSATRAAYIINNIDLFLDSSGGQLRRVVSR